MPAATHRGRPIALRVDARRAEEPVRRVLACNVNPRFSLATVLDGAQLRAAKSAPFVPGRLPAPRAEIGCGPSPSGQAEAVGVFYDFNRGASPLPPNRPGGPPVNPPVAPPVGPPVAPDVPPGPPSGGPTTPPPGGGPGGPCGCDGPGPGGNMLRGRPRTLNFHLTGEIAAGALASEVRVGPRMDRPFLVRSVEVVPVSGVTIGQYVDVLVSVDEELTDVAAPTGSSIFEGAQNAGQLPAQDADAGLPVAAVHYDVPVAFMVADPGRVLKVVQRFVAPAVAMAALHVSIVVEEFEHLALPPIEPRPPIGPPPPPPIGEPAPPVGGAPPLPPVVAPGPSAPPSSAGLFTQVCVTNPWPLNCRPQLPRFYVGACARPFPLCKGGTVSAELALGARWQREVVLEVAEVAAKMAREPAQWG